MSCKPCTWAMLSCQVQEQPLCSQSAWCLLIVALLRARTAHKIGVQQLHVPTHGMSWCMSGFPEAVQLSMHTVSASLLVVLWLHHACHMDMLGLAACLHHGCIQAMMATVAQGSRTRCKTLLVSNTST